MFIICQVKHIINKLSLINKATKKASCFIYLLIIFYFLERELGKPQVFRSAFNPTLVLCWGRRSDRCGSLIVWWTAVGLSHHDAAVCSSYYLHFRRHTVQHRRIRSSPRLGFLPKPQRSPLTVMGMWKEKKKKLNKCRSGARCRISVHSRLIATVRRPTSFIVQTTLISLKWLSTVDYYLTTSLHVTHVIY